MMIRSSRPRPVVKILGDIPSTDIRQGFLGEVLSISSKDGDCYIRVPTDQGNQYVTLKPEVDFIFIEGDYSSCFGYRNRKEFHPWTFNRTLTLAN